jgi:hypothetical protein
MMGLHYNDATQYGFRDSLSSAGLLQLACEHQHPTPTPLQLDFLFPFICHSHFNPLGDLFTSNARHAEDHLQVTGNGC